MTVAEEENKPTNQIHERTKTIMKQSIVKSYEELPLFLNAQSVADVLGVSPSSAYELMHEKDFPSLRIGNRLVVPKDHFQSWVERNVGK
jgi:excisionase family DNA binding protein